nr:MYXO-CTERM sorting domain-containing protein [Pyxidicoccus trucidator]
MAWTVFLLGAAGETYYETAARLPSAWTDQHFYGGNGDGTLFYPGSPGRIGGQTEVPLPSLRLKLLRAGVQDYEWLMLVSQRGDPAFAEQVARELIPWPDLVPVDPAAFERARAQLIERALALAPMHPGPKGARPGPGDTASGCGCGGEPSGALVALGMVGLVWTLRPWRWRRRKRLSSG